MGNEDYALELSRQNLARRAAELEEQLADLKRVHADNDMLRAHLAEAQAQIGCEQENAAHWLNETWVARQAQDKAEANLTAFRETFKANEAYAAEKANALDELRLKHEELRGERDALEDIVADLKRQLSDARLRLAGAEDEYGYCRQRLDQAEEEKRTTLHNWGILAAQHYDQGKELIDAKRRITELLEREKELMIIMGWMDKGIFYFDAEHVLGKSNDEIWEIRQSAIARGRDVVSDYLAQEAEGRK